MKLFVSGGTGDVGRHLVRRLVATGHQVRVIGRRSNIHIKGAKYLSCDINDYPALHEATKGVDGIIHLSAIRAPNLGSPERIFGTNAGGTFNIYQAAAERGIRRVVCASSINALGYLYGVGPFSIRYLPVDEDHPTSTTDAYSFSKKCVESIGEYFDRREGISGVSFRIPWVYEANATTLGQLQETMEWINALLEKDEYSARSLEEKFRRFRRLRSLESAGSSASDDRGRGILNDEELHLYYLVTNLWTSLDSRDSAKAFELAATVRYEGHHVLFVNDDHNSAGVPTLKLARRFYPESELDESALTGTASLIQIDRARKLLGFTPDYSLSRFFS